MIDLPEDIYDLIEDANLRFDEVSNKVEKSWEYIQNKQPNNFSWITFDVSNTGVATDMSTGMIYKDNSDFKNELHKYIDAFFSDEIINHYRSSRLKEINIILGAQTHNGENLNDNY
ncbi:MAG: hypothetical protein WA087_03690 [Candidatus Saccharimonadales bacterium]